MKRFVQVVISAMTVIGVSAYAVDEHHPNADKSAPPSAATPSAKQNGMPPGTMMGSMDKMHAQMQRLMQTQDSKERDKLMREHMQTMQQHMTMMKGMMGGGMMGPDSKGGGKPRMPMDQQMGMMEQRMDMMQMMMEQMLDHQAQDKK